ncbi:hypothetical protein R69927_05601 [Paraburkholderia domus]|uniref:Uncharacterized protein n=1 Tax=Paraburkholderia domus TaxID=2793075 RepID=A0A9N8NGA2_9BURK|nr:hypothetical protein R75483_02088 [Paraburkholderia domus]CAE6824173.1 hypothetical protein R70006_06347 [Paraburkholderia domus]CAE6869991.1 hypothetical protein R69749_06102 [Paraburkholderia domus]CAE6904693.1 hypothetical protein R69927_05601 [Paraburkholderia domus]CAE6954501.1 hypothetical protein R70199_06856 [Paraburkholderia domus]
MAVAHARATPQALRAGPGGLNLSVRRPVMEKVSASGQVNECRRLTTPAGRFGRHIVMTTRPRVPAATAS